MNMYQCPNGEYDNLTRRLSSTANAHANKMSESERNPQDISNLTSDEKTFDDQQINLQLLTS